MKTLLVPACTSNLGKVLSFIEEYLKNVNCSSKIISCINIAAEEVFVNICNYAYEEVEDVCVQIEFITSLNEIEIRFIDRGKPFNPLQIQEPDITLSDEQREIGGLGIYLVKKLTDGVSYEYNDQQNILTLKKLL